MFESQGALHIESRDHNGCLDGDSTSSYIIMLDVMAGDGGEIQPGTFELDRGQVSGSVCFGTCGGNGQQSNWQLASGSVTLSSLGDGGPISGPAGSYQLVNVTGSFDLMVTNGCQTATIQDALSTHCP